MQWRDAADWLGFGSNGHGRVSTAPRLSLSVFEWPGAGAWVPWLWVPLLLLVAVPFPLFQWPLPERAVPIMWLLVAGGLVLLARVAQASWPLALLILWAVVRAAMMQFPHRGLQLLLLLTFCALLYVAARDLPPRAQPWAARLLMAALAWEMAFGVLNLFGTYPGMQWVSPEYHGRPMGFLTHTNYYGSFLALALPVAWSVLGVAGAAAVFGMVVLTFSGGPVISAAVGVLFMVWADLGRRTRWAVAGGLAGVVATVMTRHEWRLSGRREVWLTALPEYLRYPLIGQGLGSWRVWAEDINTRFTREAVQAKVAAGASLEEASRQTPPSVFATLQAHNEPYQLAFELGLIGLVLVGLWALQAALLARRAVATAPHPVGPWWAPGHLPLERAWVAVLLTAAVNSLGSNTFHLPAQAAITLWALGSLQGRAARMGTPPEPAYRPLIGAKSQRRLRRAAAERT